MWTFLRLAIRNVRRNKSRTALTLSAIGFGVLMTLFLGGFSQGFTNLFTDDSMLARCGAFQIHRAGFYSPKANPLDFDMEVGGELEKRIRSVAGVTEVAPRLSFQGMLNGPRGSSMIFLDGVDPAQEYKVLPWAPRDVIGSPIAGSSPSGAILGADLADALGLAEHTFTHGKFSNEETVVAKKDAPAAISAVRKGGQQNAMDIDVVGFVRGGTPFDAKRTGFIPLPLAQELLDLKGRANVFMVAVETRDDVPLVKERMKAALGPDYDVRDWRELRPFIGDLIDVQSRVLVFVCFVFLIIAVFGVVNTMLMSVYERTREIGTMMAVGVRRGQITLLFLLEGAALATLGGAGGTAGGLALVNGITRLGGVVITPPGSAAVRRLMPSAPMQLILITLFAATVGSIAAAAYPSWRASRLRPVEALRAN